MDLSLYGLCAIEPSVVFISRHHFLASLLFYVLARDILTKNPLLEVARSTLAAVLSLNSTEAVSS